MQLYASATSPYARKVRIALIELGIADRIAIVPTAPTEDEAFRAVNPLGKIPALRRSDGTILYDSFVIIEWLDQAFGDGALIPRETEARSAELRRHALANGVIDAAFNATMELRRSEDQRSQFWLDRWIATIEAGTRELARDLPPAFGLAAITTASAADYVTFRLGDLRLDIAELADWRRALGPRASLDTTLPQLELV